jgi:hypothetical protein
VLREYYVSHLELLELLLLIQYISKGRKLFPEVDGIGVAANSSHVQSGREEMLLCNHGHVCSLLPKEIVVTIRRVLSPSVVAVP